MPTTIGQSIDALGVEVSLSATQVITDVVLLAKVIDMETGKVSLYSASSTAVSWIEKLGMLRAAETIENQDYQQLKDDD